MGNIRSFLQESKKVPAKERKQISEQNVIEKWIPIYGPFREGSNEETETESLE